jgi:ATP-binding cassette subfamily B multidrug efflux pump
MRGKTVVAIAHRLSTIAAMDRLIVLDQGRIVEEGDHQSLLAGAGIYARLWAHQSGGFLVDEERDAERDAERPAERQAGRYAEPYAELGGDPQGRSDEGRDADALDALALLRRERRLDQSGKDRNAA